MVICLITLYWSGIAKSTTHLNSLQSNIYSLQSKASAIITMILAAAKSIVSKQNHSQNKYLLPLTKVEHPRCKNATLNKTNSSKVFITCHQILFQCLVRHFSYIVKDSYAKTILSMDAELLYTFQLNPSKLMHKNLACF